MLKDIRFAFRQLLKQPAFTAIAVLTIALAIGATTAVLSLVNGLLVRPLPYREPQQLILLLQHFKSQNLERIPVSPPEFKDYETRARSFEKLGAFGYANFNLAGEDRPERISGAAVTAGVLPLLGISPIKGRFFQPEECTLGRDDVVIISARLWQRRFNSDPHIIGTKLLLNGKNFTVVGVMPAGFDFPLQLFNLGNGGQFGGRAEIWKPLTFTDEEMKERGSRGYTIIGRLAPGTSAARTHGQLQPGQQFWRRRIPAAGIGSRRDAPGAAYSAWRCLSGPAHRMRESHHNVACARGCARTGDRNSRGAWSRSDAAAQTSIQ